MYIILITGSIFSIFLLNLAYYKIIENEKKLFYLLLHPFFYFFLLIYNYFDIILQRNKSQKAQKTEIPKLIYYLNSYLYSGMQLSHALKKVNFNHKWNKHIRSAIFLIIYYYDRGNSLEISIYKTIQAIKLNKNNQILIILLNTLSICILILTPI